jgi:hypothetical protein
VLTLLTNSLKYSLKPFSVSSFSLSRYSALLVFIKFLNSLPIFLPRTSVSLDN